jgi:AraC family ethanolamine operon transcriptional activator
MRVVTVQDLTDPTRIDEVEALNQDVVSLGRARFRARRVTVRFGKSVLVYHTSTHRVRTLTEIPGSFVAFYAVARHSKARVSGLPISSGLLAAVESGVEVELVVEPNYESVVWLVPPEALGVHLAARKRVDDFQIPHNAEYLGSEPALVQNFFDTARSIARSAIRNQDRFENRSVLSAAELSVAESLFACLGSSTTPELSSSERTPRYYSEIIRKAERYTLDHPTRRPTITDLCEAINVGERTLQNAFQEIIGTSPTAFLRRLRLHRARNALQTASYKTMTVSAVAQDWGFWHFGDFSRAYKECFLELPSETLRKRRRSFDESGATFAHFAGTR